MKALRLLAGGLTPIILLGAVVAIGAWFSRASALERRERERAAEETMIATAPAAKGGFQVVVRVVGQLAAVDSKPAISEVSGQIVKLAMNGAEVKKGDIIAVLDVPRMARRVRAQEREYQQALDGLETKKRELASTVQRAELKVAQTRGELEQFRAQQQVELTGKRSQKEKDAADLALSQQRFERQKKLADEGLVPGREVELAEAQLKARQFALERETKDLELAEAKSAADELNKEAALKEAESEVARAKSAQESEIANAEMELQMRKQQLDRVRDEFGKSTIKSPADGIVVLEQEWQGRGMQRRPLQPGDQVWEQRPIGTIADLSKMRVDIELNQEQARQVKLKQPALITVDAVPGVTFEGKVSEVSQTGSESSLPGTGIPSTERTFAAKVDIKALKRAKLRPGMTAQTRIIVEKVGQAVSIPLECVFERDDRPIVFVRRGRDFLPVQVELGARNDEAVVIRKGLKGGEQVALRDVGEQKREEPSVRSPAKTRHRRPARTSQRPVPRSTESAP
ncbi:MAG: efflux RND transporter periplasmic adaptor subunit [Armatimonadota bacterium]